MNRQDFYFDLPAELIAQYPLDKRSDSRLLLYNKKSKEYGHFQFRDIADLLNPGDLLVLNDSKVLKARMFARKLTGGRHEILVERLVGTHSFLAHIKNSKRLKPGEFLLLEEGKQLKLMERRDALFLCETQGSAVDLLESIGHIPLPPYISREDEDIDFQRYQTVYAKHLGSVAAPTAGLHFDEQVLRSLALKGVNVAYLTLHVGAGTFRPVRSDNIKEHKMHSEQFSISEELCAMVQKTKDSGNRVIAVGTTALRSLESASQDGFLRPVSGETDIFIYPGYTFKTCDGLITNFHLPESTLVMLVSAFIGHKETMALYEEAISKKYRFFSYGDTSLLV